MFIIPQPCIGGNISPVTAHQKHGIPSLLEQEDSKVFDFDFVNSVSKSENYSQSQDNTFETQCNTLSLSGNRGFKYGANYRELVESVTLGEWNPLASLLVDFYLLAGEGGAR